MFRFLLIVFTLVAAGAFGAAAELPFDTVFKGRAKFDELVSQASLWKSLPIGERAAAVGMALTGTPYQGSTLEIDDLIEAPSANFDGMDCWTFFEIALGFARMLDEPRENWRPEFLLKYIELDRYRGGRCDGSYLSRLHYLEEWLYDNKRRGIIRDLTASLGGISVTNSAVEMTINYRSYRYMRNNPEVQVGIKAMEKRVVQIGLIHIPKSRVKKIESELKSGDIIGVTTHDGKKIGTSHVGFAHRTNDGVLHFLHAASPRNDGRVVLGPRLSDYLASHKSIAGIVVARPLR